MYNKGDILYISEYYHITEQYNDRSLNFVQTAEENLKAQFENKSGEFDSSKHSEIEKKYYGAIAVEVETGKWSNAYNYPSNSSAREKVLASCGKNCKVMDVHAGRCGAVAYSKLDKTVEFDSAISGFAGAGYETRRERASEKALKKCSKKSKDCIILTSVCNDGGI